jgi:hypothetical protein
LSLVDVTALRDAYAGWLQRSGRHRNSDQNQHNKHPTIQTDNNPIERRRENRVVQEKGVCVVENVVGFYDRYVVLMLLMLLV